MGGRRAPMDELRIESESVLGLDSGSRRNDDGRADASRPMCRVPWASSALPTNCAGQGSRAAKQACGCNEDLGAVAGSSGTGTPVL